MSNNTPEIKNKTVLGRGLNSLLGHTVNRPEATGQKLIEEITLQRIKTNPNQPRKTFREEDIQELASSIQTYGIIQPITVRPGSQGDYELISGERRLRAARSLGLKSIPAYVKNIDNENILGMALVENIQRSDLNPIEIALSYQTLIEDLDITQEQLSTKVGKKRSTINNYLRLLKLPLEIQISLKENQISMGHARALISISSPNIQRKLLYKILEEGLSVRKTEELAQSIQKEKQDKPENKLQESIEETSNIRKSLIKKLGIDLSIKLTSGEKGYINIPFENQGELESISKLLAKDE